MKILHLADLHIGKKVNGFNMLEDQRYALEQIIGLIKREGVEAVIIAGDVYDVPVPAGEAMEVFEDLLLDINELEIPVLVIPGNHDSIERVSFGNRFFERSRIYIADKYRGQVERVSLEDSHGPINFYLLPYLRPASVKRYFPDEEIRTYQDALAHVLGAIDLDSNERNVIVAHQFIVGAQLGDSEEIYLGDQEAVSLDLFTAFDYIALGHIHKRQGFLNGKAVYPGALLKYGKREAGHDKTLTLVDIREKGDIEVIEKRIDYLRDMRIIKGAFAKVVENSKVDPKFDDYIHMVLTDEDEVSDAINRLRDLYPNIMTLAYENKRTSEEKSLEDLRDFDEKSPLTMFEHFYEFRNNAKLSPDKEKLIKEIIDEVWGNESH